MSKPTIICLTPVRNEAWIIERFIQCASLWADRIIIADQNSTDNTVALARKYSKVTVIENSNSEYDEVYRQKMLLAEARKTSGKKLLVTLDADEFLTANFHTSAEWETALQADEGTLITFNWANLAPGFSHCNIDPTPMSWGFMDNGAEHEGRKLHSQRVPLIDDAKVIHLQEIKVLHYAYISSARLNSKQRWYMCFEYLNKPDQNLRGLFNRYKFQDRSNLVSPSAIKPEWFSFYTEKGIDMTSIKSNFFHAKRVTGPENEIGADKTLFEYFWWDFEVLRMMKTYGANKFAVLPIWNFNWAVMAAHTGESNWQQFLPNKTLSQKIVAYLTTLQPTRFKNTFEKIANILVRLLH